MLAKNFDMSYDKDNLRGGYNVSKPVKRRVTVKENGQDVEKAYLDNLDPFCYIYEPQEFVDSMNNAIAEAYRDYGNTLKDIPKFAFFHLDNGKLTFYQNVDSTEKIIFSENL